MKVTTEETNKEQEIKYPCLMVHKEDPDIIMLMVGEKDGAYQGIALYHPNIPNISYWDKTVLSWFKDMFTPMNGKVILENG
jgi:hypothetical protein